MALINGTSDNDTITPSFVSPGVTGGIPSDDPDTALLHKSDLGKPVLKENSV